nr:hypothetical protein [Tanacetum cinerariifolium]
MSPKNKAHYESKKEVIHLLLTRIGDEIYSIVDACKTAHEIWIAIERLQQSESLNIQDQYQNEVNELYAEKLARNANPLALVATAQASQDQYYQTSRSHRSSAPSPKPSIPSRSQTTTRHKGKEIAKPITPPSGTTFEEDIDPEQANPPTTTSENPQTPRTRMWIRHHEQYDWLADTDEKVDEQELEAHYNYMAKIKEVPNADSSTDSEPVEQNMDTDSRYKNDNQTGQFRNQRTVKVVGARETVGSQVVQQTRIQCFNCKEFGHFTKECRKPKRVKDSTYHKEKMLLCKQAEKGVSLQVEQANWLEDTDEEIDEQELEARYNFMPKIQEVPNADLGTDTKPLEQDDSNVTPDSPDMCDNDIHTNQNAKDERVTLANLIANLKLDVDENKKIQKQLKKANTTLAHEFKGCKSILEKTSRTLGESNSIQDSCLIALQNKQTEFE